MPTLSAELVVRSSAPFRRASDSHVTNSLPDRVRAFEKASRAAAQAAAATATATSRSSFRYLRPPAGAQRPGRESTGGRFPNYLEWKVDQNGQVALDLDQLDSNAPHWIILEIGTGKRAEMRAGGDAEEGSSGLAPRATLRTVPSQRGRRIHSAFVFADGPGGQYSPPGAERGQQLFARSRVIGAPRQRLGIVIKNEIEGQHFVKKGAEAGFREYRRSVLTAARQAFRKGTAG